MDPELFRGDNYKEIFLFTRRLFLIVQIIKTGHSGIYYMKIIRDTVFLINDTGYSILSFADCCHNTERQA